MRKRSGGRNGNPPRIGSPRFAGPMTLRSILGWTALSALLPGLGHLRAGRRRTGYVLLGLFAASILAALLFGLTRNESNLAALATTGTLLRIAVGAAVLALLWFGLVLSSYVSLGPNRLNQRGQLISGGLVGLLCVAVMAPFAVVANAALTTRSAAQSIFRSTGDPALANPETDPWNGKDRVNFLLIGSDAAGNRTGVRTDSMNVASISVRTGDTVMFSLPRNLQHVRFPADSPLAKQFPHGFMAELPNGGLLNEVWQYANEHPEVMGGRHRGPRALMDAIGHTLNLKIDYYAMINMYGFAELVDAIGGLQIRVDQDVRFGGVFGTAGTIKAGYRRLSGEEALWYGRSRVGADDFARMGRQRCVIGAFSKQVTPDVILSKFNRIAAAAKRMAETNMPEELLPALTDLTLKVKGARITSLQFVPPAFWPGAADWAKIRQAAARAVKESSGPSRRQLAAESPVTPAGAAAPTVSARSAQSPSRTPTRAADTGNARSIDEICGL